MKIRKYIARNMPEALQQVRDDFGEHAVILNTRQLRRNSRFNNTDQHQVEVTAAIDETIGAETYLAPEKSGSSRNIEESSMEHSNYMNVGKRHFTEKSLDVQDTKFELTDIVSKTKKENSRIETLCHRFRENGITEEIIEHYFKCASEEQSKGKIVAPEELNFFTKTWFNSLLPECRRLKIAEDRQVIGFVGSAGAGKTTAIGKIAGSFAKIRKDGVVIISTDNSRIGALDQLQSLARLIDVRFEMAFDEMELNVMLDCYKDAQFVLIDGPAYGCLDEGPLNRLKKNYRSIGVDEVHIVLDANNDFRYMMDMINKSSFFPNRRLLFTKLDQVSRVGTVLSAAISSEIPTSYISNSAGVTGGIESGDLKVVYRDVFASGWEEGN